MPCFSGPSTSLHLGSGSLRSLDSSPVRHDSRPHLRPLVPGRLYVGRNDRVVHRPSSSTTPGSRTVTRARGVSPSNRYPSPVPVDPSVRPRKRRDLYTGSLAVPGGFSREFCGVEIHKSRKPHKRLYRPVVCEKWNKKNSFSSSFSGRSRTGA